MAYEKCKTRIEKGDGNYYQCTRVKDHTGKHVDTKSKRYEWANTGATDDTE